MFIDLQEVGSLDGFGLPTASYRKNGSYPIVVLTALKIL